MASSRGAHEAQQQRKQQHETLVAVLSLVIERKR